MPPLLRFLRGATPRPNAAPCRLRITLARRLVETPGAPFAPTGEVFTDGASALDELGLLPAAQGPTVVRVRIEGGTVAEREALAGDWLVDPDTEARVTHLVVPEWDYNRATKAWVSTYSWLEAWETCQNSIWMLHAASRVGVDRKLLVLASCACARTALPYVPSGEARPLRAIEAAERWTRGEATDEEVRAAGEAASAAANADLRRRAALYAIDAAADAASFADSDFPVDLDGVGDASSAAASAAAAAAAAADEDDARNAQDVSLARCAELVRGVISTLTVLRAVATRA